MSAFWLLVPVLLAVAVHKFMSDDPKLGKTMAVAFGGVAVLAIVIILMLLSDRFQTF